MGLLSWSNDSSKRTTTKKKDRKNISIALEKMVMVHCICDEFFFLFSDSFLSHTHKHTPMLLLFLDIAFNFNVQFLCRRFTHTRSRWAATKTSNLSCVQCFFFFAFCFVTFDDEGASCFPLHLWCWERRSIAFDVHYSEGKYIIGSFRRKILRNRLTFRLFGWWCEISNRKQVEKLNRNRLPNLNAAEIGTVTDLRCEYFRKYHEIKRH